MMTRSLRSATVVVGTAAALIWITPLDLSGQQKDSLQARLALPPLPTYQAEAPPAPPPIRARYIFPGISVSSPTALGAEGGTVYLGVGYQERTRYWTDDDGAVVAGIGVGDAREKVGLEVNATSYSTVRRGFFDRVGFGAQLHRYVNEETALAFGAENLFMINGDKSDVGRSYYAVITQLFALKADPVEPFSLITASLGVGNGRFRTEKDVFADRSTVGVFGALSVHVIRPVAAIADWTGQDLALGLSVAPFERFPLVITPAFMDVTRNAGDGARFVIAAGVGRRLTAGPIQF
ncbi:MAG TPA: hypothetical protein VF021_05215 [Longimicrobiales bacterium]